MKAIKENDVEENLTAGNSHTPKVSACDIVKLQRSIYSKKSTGIDKVQPKLTKRSAMFLNKPLATASNNSFNKIVFSDSAKIACFSLLDKNTDGKYSVTFEFKYLSKNL